MKREPIKETSLLGSTIVAAILSLASAYSLEQQDTLPYQNTQQLCIQSGFGSERQGCFKKTHDDHTKICGASSESEINATRASISKIQQRTAVETPLLGRLFGVEVTQSYEPNLTKHTDYPYQNFEIVEKCEALQPSYQITDSQQSRAMSPFLKKIILNDNDLLVMLISGLISFFGLKKIIKRKKQQKLELQRDIAVVSMLDQTNDPRQRIATYREQESNEKDITNALNFLFFLKSTDQEKYQRWIAAIEAKIAGKKYKNGLEPSWEQICEKLTIPQLQQLICELREIQADEDAVALVEAIKTELRHQNL